MECMRKKLGFRGVHQLAAQDFVDAVCGALALVSDQTKCDDAVLSDAIDERLFSAVVARCNGLSSMDELTKQFSFADSFWPVFGAIGGCGTLATMLTAVFLTLGSLVQLPFPRRFPILGKPPKARGLPTARRSHYP